MNGEAEKFQAEKQVFLSFARMTRLPLAHAQIEKGDANRGEPDIRCHLPDGLRYFELTESCNPTLAAASHPDPLTSPTEGINNTCQTVNKKLAKHYRVAAPVELIIYTAGQTRASDDEIVAAVRPLLAQGLGPFRAVWFFGEAVTLLASA